MTPYENQIKWQCVESSLLSRNIMIKFLYTLPFSDSVLVMISHTMTDNKLATAKQ